MRNHRGCRRRPDLTLGWQSLVAKLGADARWSTYRNADEHARPAGANFGLERPKSLVFICPGVIVSVPATCRLRGAGGGH